MERVLKFLRTRFNQPSDSDQIGNYAVFDEGNRGGFPSNVVAFDYENGVIAIGTLSGEVSFYGYKGASWSIDLNKTVTTNVDVVNIVKIHFVSKDKLFVLCRGPFITCLEIKDGIILLSRNLCYSENYAFKWNCTFIRKKFEALVFYMDNQVFQLYQNKPDTQTLVDKDHLENWIAQETEITHITHLPENPRILLFCTADGTILVFKEQQISMKLEMKNFEDDPILQLFWSSTENIAYGISSNHTYTKWKFTLGKDDYVRTTEISIYDSKLFGPYPCHQIKHFNVATSNQSDGTDILIYQGGKSSGKYDDRDLITLRVNQHSEKLEVSSEVVGIATVDGSYDDNKNAGIILICTKCEIIGIDLKTEFFNMLQPRHFISINNSTPTTHAKTIEIEENVWNRLETARHSNGNICVWTTGGVNMALSLIIKTSLEFECGSTFQNDSDDLEETTKNTVRRIGLYDPFDDDEEMCITRVCFDSKSGMILATNRGGYVLMYELYTIQSCQQNLKPRKESVDYISGYQPRKTSGSETPLVFLVPRCYQTLNIAYVHKYNCLVIGTNLGTIFLDIKCGGVVQKNCYEKLENRIGDCDGNRLQRFKSLKKSLRRTFRRKKKALEADSDKNLAKDEERKIEDEAIFVERKIETPDEELDRKHPARLSRAVTCLKAMRFPLLDEKNIDDVIAVGLSDGVVLFYAISEHDIELQISYKAEEVTILSVHVKQPILNIDITNEDLYFSATTNIVVMTDEQVRVYSCLPMRKQDSYKVTALEGLKIKNGSVSRIVSKKSSNSFESFIVVLLNDGSVRIHAMKNLTQFKTRCLITHHDAIALNSCCLSKDGTMSYLSLAHIEASLL
ncbi:unnamed protein product [Caenorhabditis sp. 36 PRJEB53466]|nr:unnamed protein product [Caenorhabditis sp. 36 PRJEB53466]